MTAARLVIISGTSGSGKSTALNAFEDYGYFCVENLPAPLINNFVELLSQPANEQGAPSPSGSLRKCALLVDCRDDQSFPHVKAAMQKLEKAGIQVDLLFFDCQDESILRRYSETRRPHPQLQAGASTVAEGLVREREILAGFRETATKIIDTTNFSPHDLRRVVEDFCGHRNQLEVTVISFGYKYGIPQDADLLVDVRFLCNPHFVKELRPLTGVDQRVVDYVFSAELSEEFVQRYVSLLDFLIPNYREEGKTYLTVAVGCTGGRHRSVALANRIRQELVQRGIPAKARHRDIARN